MKQFLNRLESTSLEAASPKSSIKQLDKFFTDAWKVLKDLVKTTEVGMAKDKKAGHNVSHWEDELKEIQKIMKSLESTQNIYDNWAGDYE